MPKPFLQVISARVSRGRVGKPVADYLVGALTGRDKFELEVIDLAEVLVFAARNRKESRGGHMRDDYPNRDDENYMKHTMAYLVGDPHSADAEDHIRLDWKPVVFTKNEKGELNYPPLERKY